MTRMEQISMADDACQVLRNTRSEQEASEVREKISLSGVGYT